MLENPLAAPIDRELLTRFLTYFRIDSRQTPRQMLTNLATAFSQLPYENLSKIVKFEQSGNVLAARQYPREIIDGHIQYGAGGTCFSLTSTLLYLVRSLGFSAEPILADRRYGPDTHCALLVWVEEVPHLLDPGFLLVQPVPLPRSEVSIETGFNTVILVPQPNEKLDLWTRDLGGKRYRLTFKTTPVDAGQFLRAWDQSYGWEMMQYPLLTKVTNQKQVYLRGTFQQIREGGQVTKRDVPLGELAAMIASQFGIHESLVMQALTVWDHRGQLQKTR
jgi:arylamine N-acetyltransferase